MLLLRELAPWTLAGVSPEDDALAGLPSGCWPGNRGRGGGVAGLLRTPAVGAREKVVGCFYVVKGVLASCL